MPRNYKLTLAITLLALFSCSTHDAPDDSTKVLVMGDSLLASNKMTGNAVSDAIEDELGIEVVDQSRMGAFLRPNYSVAKIVGKFGIDINQQYIAGPWDWVVVNGGGNDLWLGCGCRRCKGQLDSLISEDQKSGTLPGLVETMRWNGAKVIIVGYLRTHGVTSPIEHCKNVGDEFERRIHALSLKDEGTVFLSLADLVPKGSYSYHAIDRIHPSAKASLEIGKLIAEIIRNDGKL